MKRIVSALVVIGTISGMAMGGDLHPIASARIEQSLSASNEGGKMLVSAREMLVEGKHANGKPAKGNLMVLFDPATGLFVWYYARLPIEYNRLYQIDQAKSGRVYVYSDHDQLVIFGVTVAPLEIYIRTGNEKAASMDDAENKAIQRAGEQLEAIEGNYLYGRKKISLVKELDIDFYSEKMSATSSPAKFVDVSRQGGNWEIILEDQWKEKITLNDKFELVKVAREQ